MICGIGIDLTEIDRMESAVQKPHFVSRVFTEQEQVYANAGSFPAQSYAAMYAAKEALLKAFGTGLGGADFVEIEVLHDEKGKPVLRLYGKAKERLALCGAKRVHISLSHSKQYAVAQVILED